MKPKLVLSLVALMLVAVLGSPRTLAAQQQGGGGAQKIAFVNLRAILAQTAGYAKAESTYAKEIEGYRSEVSKLQASLDSAAAEFEQSSVMLSPTARGAKRKELEAQQQKLEQRAAELRERAATRERELLDPIQQRVMTVIDGIRAEGNYGFIFDAGSPANGIVSVDRSLDLTQRVIERLKASK